MTLSYKLKIDPKSRAAGRFIGRVRKELISAALDAKKSERITQQQVATKLGVHRSVINRYLRGEANLTLRSIAELAWALGYEPSLKLCPKAPPSTGQNHFEPGHILSNAKQVSTTSPATVRTKLSRDNEATPVKVLELTE